MKLSKLIEKQELTPEKLTKSELKILGKVDENLKKDIADMMY